MEEKLDAVKMVREIRDRLSAEMINIDDDKLVEYINERGKRALEELRRKARDRLRRTVEEWRFDDE